MDHLPSALHIAVADKFTSLCSTCCPGIALERPVESQGAIFLIQAAGKKFCCRTCSIVITMSTLSDLHKSLPVGELVRGSNGDCACKYSDQITGLGHMPYRRSATLEISCVCVNYSSPNEYFSQFPWSRIHCLIASAFRNSADQCGQCEDCGGSEGEGPAGNRARNSEN